MASQYLLPCNCGKKITVDSRQAGESITCKCGQTLVVPTLRGLRALETAGEPARSDAQPRATRPWSPMQGVMFSLGLALAVVSAVFCVRHFVSYRSLAPHTVDRTAEMDLHTNEAIDQLSPSESIDVWEIFSASTLGDEGLPPWVAIKQAADAQQRTAIVWFVLMVVGLTATVASFFVGARGPRAGGERQG